MPGQLPLFSADSPAEVIGSLRGWATDDLWHLVDAGSIELLRRGRAIPVRAPVAQAMTSYPCADAGVTSVSAIADA